MLHPKPMKHFFWLFFFIPVFAFSQDHSFPYGYITYKQFEQTAPEKDSTAVAIVLNEFGEAYISNNINHNLIFEHHYVIKILKKEGLEEANIEIPLAKNDKKYEMLLSLKATSYTIENNRIVKTDLDPKNVFTENSDKYWDQKKFTIPNVREGSIIEVQYKLESPFFVRNFRTWEFQSHLPKLVSEYWASIPGNYRYNISWKGFLKFSKNETSVVKDCFDVGGGNRADCGHYKFAMKNIPAFIEEDYMTAKSNFIASINFELEEIQYFDGQVDRVTTQWKDADTEMVKDPNFGGQLKKGKDIAQKIESQLTLVTDPLEKAKIIYDFVKRNYQWNGYYSKYSEGIKKAFESKKGSIGDINLSLIAALRSQDLDVESLLLSTRNNGWPTELFPVLSDFNYVVAKLNMGDKVYLLDASDQLLPFGMLPEQCLNDKGRVFGDKKPSYWYNLKATEKYKKITVMDLTVESNGTFKGTVQHQYVGYSAYGKRREIFSFGNQEDYIQKVKSNLHQSTISNYTIKGAENLTEPLVEKFNIEIENPESSADHFLLNPFIFGKLERNPFRASERLYPVDFGAPIETTLVLNLTLPSAFQLESAPDRAGLTLPNAGGKLLFEVVPMENKITVNYLFTINKTLFSSTEYHYLKELYDRVIQTQGADLILKKK